MEETKFDIAVGKSRHDKTWVNKEFTWPDLLKKLSKTTRTHETLDEYNSFTKNRQDEIKDVGGFISGTLNKGRRLKENVLSKQILTLDVDEPPIDFWNIITLLFDNTLCIYSTHKHQKNRPKYRLLIPLKKPVLKDEYEAIIRKVSSIIGINYIDHTCFRPTQLMYWPSTSKDGEYVFKEQKGDLLNPDDILDLYHNWKDINEWPIGDREKKQKEHLAKKQGDPLTKPGLIGFFNSAYTIEEAIDQFIPDMYEKISDNRYTYKLGSTSGGVVVYEDKFIYSHHSTDPISGTLCNAFDLIRLHKFSLEDSDVDENCPINKLPSYLSMCNLAANDNKVKIIIGQDKLSSAKEIFKDIKIYKESDASWLSLIDIDKKGNYINTINNVALILENDPNLINNLAYDEFLHNPVWFYDLPWRKTDKNKNLTESDLANLENYIEKKYSISVGHKLLKGISVICEKNSFHPIKDYINSLTWDEVPRLDRLLIDYLGCDDSDYVRSITRKCLVAAVARVFNPGIKYDTILVLVGSEGQGKSTIWDKLGKNWFNDTFSLNMLKSKEAYEQLQGSWIIEIAELSGMAKAEEEHVKSFVSSRKDKYRVPYARVPEERLRQCIFVGSTNVWDFLRSQNGNRRFWPTLTNVTKPIKSVYTDLSNEVIDQIWAEAYNYYQLGENIYLDDFSILAEAVLKQNEFTEEDPLAEMIEDYLSYKIPENWYNLSLFDKREFINNYDENKTEGLTERKRVCKYEIWELVLNKKDILDSYWLKKIKHAMRKIKGWKVDKDLIRFGNFYPRHRGSWIKEA